MDEGFCSSQTLRPEPFNAATASFCTSFSHVLAPSERRLPLEGTPGAALGTGSSLDSYSPRASKRPVPHSLKTTHTYRAGDLGIPDTFRGAFRSVSVTLASPPARIDRCE